MSYEKEISRLHQPRPHQLVIYFLTYRYTQVLINATFPGGSKFSPPGRIATSSTAFLNIERGNNFFYFSKLGEPNSELEKKLERFERYIDIVDLLASMDNKITIGSRFRPGEIAEECNANVRLKQKLQKIPLYRSETLHNKVREICDLMSRDSFLEMEDEKTESYKVLDAYTYLLDVINSVAIYEDTSLDNDNASGLIYN